MTTHLENDPELDALLRAADPADTDAVQRLTGSAGATALRDAITSGEVTSQRSSRRYLRPAVLIGAAAAAVATTVTLTLVSPSSSNNAYGAELTRFAENSPRFLVSAPGWQIGDVDEEDSTNGEMTFTNG